MNRRDAIRATLGGLALATGGCEPPPASAPTGSAPTPGGMVVDYRDGSGAANIFGVADADTGEILDWSFPYFYADERAGVLRRYKVDARGRNYVEDPGSPDPVVAWEEVRRRIRVVPREGLSPEAREWALRRIADASGRAERCS